MSEDMGHEEEMTEKKLMKILKSKPEISNVQKMHITPEPVKPEGLQKTELESWLGLHLLTPNEQTKALDIMPFADLRNQLCRDTLCQAQLLKCQSAFAVEKAALLAANADHQKQVEELKNLIDTKLPVYEEDVRAETEVRVRGEMIGLINKWLDDNQWQMMPFRLWLSQINGKKGEK
jgi:hypothetical protein